MPAAVNGMKECSKCGETKDVSEYGKRKKNKDGLTCQCKSCISDKNKTYYQNNKERYKRWNRKNKLNNKERYKLVNEEWIRANKEHLRNYQREYQNTRYREDVSFKLRLLLNNRIRLSLKQSREHKKNKVKTNKEYYNKYFSVLDYSPEDLVEHIERQWIEGWDWNNYGEVWVVDHIYPHSKLPYDSIEHPNYKKAWALRNLRPLSKEDNSSKSDKVLGEYDDITLVVE